MTMVLMFVAACGLVPLSTAGAASAPSVKLSQPTFTVYQPEGDGPVDFTFHWTVTAPAGVCSQTFTDGDYDTLPSTETVALAKTARSYAVQQLGTDYPRGGYTAYVRITECNGKILTSNTVHVVQWASDDTSAGLSYSSGWGNSSCTCFEGGSTEWTSTKNASVTFQTVRPVDVTGYNDTTGVDLALIMPKAANRGSAAIYIDGVKKATINTYSKTSINRTIAYQTLLTGTASHTVKIVNLATSGHPRIDIDVVLNGG